MDAEFRENRYGVMKAMGSSNRVSKPCSSKPDKLSYAEFGSKVCIVRLNAPEPN